MAVTQRAVEIRNLISRRPYHLLLPFTAVWLIKPSYLGAHRDWVELGIAWPLFLTLYVLAHAERVTVSVAALAFLTLLGVVYVPLNPEASGIFAFAAAILAAVLAERHRSLTWLWVYLSFTSVLLLAEALVFHLNLWTWIGGGSGAVLISLYVLLNARERETNLQLQLAQDEIGRLARLAERERITRDLHDVLGHTLSLIAMKSELAQKRFSVDPHATLVEAAEIETISRDALVRVREAIHGYAEASLLQEIHRLSAALESAGVKVECHLGEVSMSSVQESVLSMILQEAVTNIVRHAHAEGCRIELLGHEGAVQLLVVDDGCGSTSYDGFGLRGMRERLRLLGGSLQVTARNGTELQATLPRI